jgi:hypothetical protein
MDGLNIRIMRKALRLAHKAFRVPELDSDLDDGHPDMDVHAEGQAASDLIRERLLAAEPCMISRFGSNELNTALRRANRRSRSFVLNAWRHARGEQGPFWWDDAIRKHMRNEAGLFPCTDNTLIRFADGFLSDLWEVDVLGSWARGERDLAPYFPQAKIVPLRNLEPYYHKDPWTTALERRNVLVIHPFEISIRQQYEKRALLFADRRILPEFALKTFKSVQSIAGNDCGFNTWFEALDWMCERVREIEFDVALIGAGAYGLPLAAFVKRMGRKAVHLGGATQLLFGIRGKRWDYQPWYPELQKLYNEHWVRPLPEEIPNGYQTVESGCYW